MRNRQPTVVRVYPDGRVGGENCCLICGTTENLAGRSPWLRCRPCRNRNDKARRQRRLDGER